MTEKPHVIVLAGGAGRRLASLTRALYGTDLPKQFAILDGDRSLLQTTIERALALTSADRISVVVTSPYEALARDQLAPYGVEMLLVQPRGLDTGPGLLFPLVRVLANSSSGRVVVLPSDHHISDPTPIERTLAASARGPLRGRVSLVGVMPTSDDIDYGWIVRGDRIAGSAGHIVKRFHEKPTAAEADALRRAGALWNTFILAGPADRFWDLARQQLPHHARAFERYAIALGGLDEAAALEAVYSSLPAANFSREVLARADALAVLPVADTGWSDWGSPARVFASLAGTDRYARLVDRVRGEALAG